MGADSGRVLVVDDDTANRSALCDCLKQRGYEAVGARDGAVALELLARDAFDLVLLDITMPGINGFEVLRRVRETYSRSELPVIMVTGWGERGHTVHALESGANDYITKPLDLPIVLARLRTQLALKRAYDHIWKLEHDLELRNAEIEATHRELQDAYGRMKGDLASAASVQRSLLPSTLPEIPGVRFAWMFEPCADLAGDILDVFSLDDEHVAFYLLDVSGHGVRAALLSVTLSRILAPQGDRPSLVQRRRRDGDGLEPTPPHEVAEELNRRFQLDLETWQYFTLFYGVLNTRTRRLRYVSAGQPGPIYAPAGGGPVDLSRPVYAIGWVPDPHYATRELTLAPGDRLYLISDGITEARSAEKKLFGTDRVLRALASGRMRAPQDCLAQVLREAELFCGRPFDDDVSALVLEITPALAPRSALPAAPAGAGVAPA